MLLSIKEIYLNPENISQLSQIKVGGWVKSVREGKEKVFVILNDGSVLKSLQLVISSKNFSQTDLLSKINFGSSLLVSGRLILTPQREQDCELVAIEVEFINLTNDNYPFQKKNIPLEIVRNFPHLRAKTNYFSTVFRLRHNISKAIHNFFHQEGFYYVPTPIITSNDTEGAGEFFSVNTSKKEFFFSKPANLTVSGQIHAESLAQGLGKVYTFGPCFRADQSQTTRHLAEFWMVEAEITWADLTQITDLAARLIKHTLDYVLTNNLEELEYLEKYQPRPLITKLKNLVSTEFRSLSYEEGLKILAQAPGNFQQNNILWGMDFQAEHEKYLCQYFNNQPLFILNYPQELKPFYMKNNPDGKTVACFDLIFPEIGELIGGSLREDNYQILVAKAQKNNLDCDNLSWYLDLRKYGYAPSTGFGLGLERLIMLVSGSGNIRDMIAFPRSFRHLDF